MKSSSPAVERPRAGAGTSTQDLQQAPERIILKDKSKQAGLKQFV